MKKQTISLATDKDVLMVDYVYIILKYLHAHFTGVPYNDIIIYVSLM